MCVHYIRLMCTLDQPRALHIRPPPRAFHMEHFWAAFYVCKVARGKVPHRLQCIQGGWLVKAGTPSKQIEPDKISWTTRKISPCSCVLSTFTLETRDHYILVIAILIMVGIVVIVVGIVVIVGWIMVIIAQMGGGLHYPEPPPHAAPLVSGGYLNCLGKRGPIKATIKGPLIKAPVVSLYLEWCCANSEQSGTRHNEAHGP